SLPLTQIWAARYLGPSSSTGYCHFLWRENAPGVTDSPIQCQEATFSIRQLALQVFTIGPTPGPVNIQVPTMWTPATLQIWPVVAPQVWPPARALDDAG